MKVSLLHTEIITIGNRPTLKSIDLETEKFMQASTQKINVTNILINDVSRLGI